ncbi:unnamed protein product [Camellia sinensis]
MVVLLVDWCLFRKFLSLLNEAEEKDWRAIAFSLSLSLSLSLLLIKKFRERDKLGFRFRNHMNVMRRLKSIASGRSSVSDPV